jgi:hypothetical protein
MLAICAGSSPYDRLNNHELVMHPHNKKTHPSLVIHADTIFRNELAIRFHVPLEMTVRKQSVSSDNLTC